MSAPTETQNKNNNESAPESPTTARPLDLSDDDVQETGILGDDGNTTTATTNTSQRPAATETAPPKPPRPSSEAQNNAQILKEAFPSVDLSVIKAILRASGGRVEPAFNALLEMTDPDAVINEPEEVPPPQPPRPQNRRQLSQLEADELYARQLAEQYDNAGAYENRTSNRGPNDRPRGSHDERRGYGDNRPGQQNWNGDDREHSFMDDDLPVIRENLRKGFLETQKQVNGWLTNLKKKIEENFDESDDYNQGQGQGQGHGQQQNYRRPGESSRRSGDYDRYDADPQVLSDDFAGMKFTADGTPVNRPLANNNLYQPPPPSASPKPSSNGRRVGFKEETEEINMYESSPKVPPKDSAPASGARGSKWQPLSTVEPSPITDNDPFSLGDSEDERDTTHKPKDTKDTKDPKTDDDERLKKAAAEAMSDSLVGSSQDDAAAKKN